MEFENQGFKCRTFGDTAAIIRKAEAKIKEAKNTKERLYYAQDILLEAEVLLSCPNYNSNNPDCLSCQLVLRRYIQEYKHLPR